VPKNFTLSSILSIYAAICVLNVESGQVSGYIRLSRVVVTLIMIISCQYFQFLYIFKPRELIRQI